LSDNDLHPIVAISADLLSAGRIRGSAQELGAVVEVLSGRVDALARIRALRPRRILLDLDSRWLDPIALIQDLKGDAELAAIPVIAYVSHVRDDAIAAARAAGADRVLARGAFVKLIPGLLA
jgi:CheY-like chemotaxis protein